MIEKDFDIPFIADLALREKQIQQNYRPVIAVHKWFALRCGFWREARRYEEDADRHAGQGFYRRYSPSDGGAHSPQGFRLKIAIIARSWST
jgi:hypothetical protein